MPNVGGKKFPYTPEGMAAAKRASVGMEKGGSPEAQSFIKSRIGDKIKNLAGVAIPGGSATKRKVQKYKGGGCVMAGRGMKNTKMS